MDKANKAVALQIMETLKVFKTEEQRGEVLQAAYGDPQRAMTDKEQAAADKIDLLLGDLSLKDDTLALIEERLDFIWGVCDLCDAKGPVRKMTEGHSYCTLGCDK